MSLLCRVCGNALGHSIFSGRLCGDTADYFDCLVCGYVQTQPPTWLDRAYAHPINRSDTGVMIRNWANCRIVLATLALLGRRRERVLDCAGGYGILVRMLRDRGVDARWSDRYCENLLARGFEHDGHPAGLVTAFEAFEHFTDPVGEMSAMFAQAPNLLISTEIVPHPAPPLDQWWYYGMEHGQHIGFFRRQTLKVLADRFGKRLVTDGRSHHLFTEEAVSPTAWRTARLVSRLLPRLYSAGLKSKVWPDFQAASRLP